MSTPVVDIEFRLEDRVTVFHGRNGSGKTIALSLIEAVREGRYRELLRYPLTMMSIEATDGRKLALSRVDSSNQHLNYRMTTDGITTSEGSWNAKPKPGEVSDDASVQTELNVRLFTRVGKDEWQRGRVNTMTGMQALNSIRNSLPRSNFDDISCLEPAYVLEFRRALPPIKAIRADRLHYSRTPENVRFTFGHDPFDDTMNNAKLMVEHLSEEVRTVVQQADKARKAHACVSPQPASRHRRSADLQRPRPRWFPARLVQERPRLQGQRRRSSQGPHARL